MLIFKILLAPQWDRFQADGHFQGAPIDLSDGYIHFSTANQAEETAAKHFAQATDLWLLAVEGDALGADLKWEVSRNNALFPHLYRRLEIRDVLWAKPIEHGPLGHVFPDMSA